MKKSITYYSPKTLWAIVIIGLLLYAYIIYAKINKVDYPDFLFGISIGVFIAVIIILISDMVNNKINNKNFWILSMFIMSPVASLIYMIQRNKLIRLGV